MAKRFTSTEKWSDPWYRKLSPKHKCLWDWLFTQCDIAGTIDPDLELASFQIGDKVTIDDLRPFECRMQMLESGRYYLTKFIEFQYGVLTNECRAHRPVLVLIDRLSIPYTNQLDSDKEQDKDQEQDQDKEQNKDKEKTWKNDFAIYQSECDAAYNIIIANNEYVVERQKYHPSLDIALSLEKAWRDYWRTVEGWKNKKQARIKTIDWKRTFTNALSQKINQVWKQKEGQYGVNRSDNAGKSSTKYADAGFR